MNLHKAEFMATELMREHGLFDLRWSFKFDRSLTRLGYCQHRIKTISLSRHATLVNDEATVRNTCLHEIAHSLVGPQHGHDAVWRAKAKEIGCTGDRLGHIAVKAPYQYFLSCNDCGNLLRSYYRRPNLHPSSIHKCSSLIKRIGYVHGQPWAPVKTNLRLVDRQVGVIS